MSKLQLCWWSFALDERTLASEVTCQQLVLNHETFQAAARADESSVVTWKPVSSDCSRKRPAPSTAQCLVRTPKLLLLLRQLAAKGNGGGGLTWCGSSSHAMLELARAALGGTVAWHASAVNDESLAAVVLNRKWLQQGDGPDD